MLFSFSEMSSMAASQFPEKLLCLRIFRKSGKLPLGGGEVTPAGAVQNPAEPVRVTALQQLHQPAGGIGLRQRLCPLKVLLIGLHKDSSHPIHSYLLYEHLGGNVTGNFLPGVV
jgi:hypothetical protein